MLFLRGHFASDLKGRIASNATETADPAARAIIGNKGEWRAVLERRSGRTQRAADDLTATALDFEARPAVILVEAAKIHAERNGARHCEFVAVAAQNLQVERVAAAGFLIALLGQLEIVDCDHRADRDAAGVGVISKRA